MILDYQTNPTLQVFFSHEEIIGALVRFSLNHISVLREIINASCIYEDIRFARSTFARRIGVSEKTISRITNDLQAAGLITKGRPQGMPFATCCYKLTSHAISEKKRVYALYKALKGIGFSVGLLLSKPQVSEPGVPLYSSKEYKKISSVISEAQCSAWQLTKDQEPTEQEALPTQREDNVMKRDWITPTIKRATGILNLSKWGQIKIGVYPTPAIEDAIRAFTGSKTVKNDPFSWFVKVCNEWCRKNNTTPDWDLLQDLVLEYGMPDNPTFILAGKSVDNQPIVSSTPRSQTRDTSQDNAAFLKYGPIIRAESRRKNLEWEANYAPEEVASKRAFFAQALGAPQSVLEKVAGHLQKNMVEPEPVEYEQDSIWEEV